VPPTRDQTVVRSFPDGRVTLIFSANALEPKSQSLAILGKRHCLGYDDADENDFKGEKVESFCSDTQIEQKW